MASVDRAGIFKARPTDWGMTQSKEGTPQFQMELALIQSWDNGT